MSEIMQTNTNAGDGARSSERTAPEDDPAPERGRFDFSIYGIDTDVRDRVTVRALFGFMQDAANRHAHALEMTPLVEAVNGAWLLSRLSVTLGRRPTFPGKVTVETWSGGADGVRFRRGYRFFSDGEIFGEASSEWVVAERTGHRPLRPLEIMSEAMIARCTVADRLTEARLPRRKQVTAAPCFVVKRALEFSLIDRNRHVNNSVYAEMALDAIAASIASSTGSDALLLERGLSPSSLDIHFVRELRYGGFVTLEVVRGDNGACFVSGRNDAGETAFTATVILAGDEVEHS